MPMTLHDANSTPADPCSGRCLITFDDGLQSVYKYAFPSLEEFGFCSTIFCISGFYGKKSSWDIYSNNMHLNKSQIRHLSEKGHEIGSHTKSHAYLPFLNNKSIYSELFDSRSELEDITGCPVTSCSFPYGGWTPDIWKIAQDAGYSAATLYRNHSQATTGLFPVLGVQRFDSTNDIISKLTTKTTFSILRARSNLMAHFAKGTPMWKFRKEYLPNE